jgi:hypothetical protein
VGDYARIGANETLALPGIGDCPDTVNAYNHQAFPTFRTLVKGACSERDRIL